MHEKDLNEALWKFGGYGFVIGAVLFVMIPIYWLLIASTLPQTEILGNTGSFPRLLPGSHFFDNAQALAERQTVNYYQSVLNSIIVASLYTVLSLILCSMSGFAFAKYDFRFKELIFLAILGTLIIPINLLVIPLFLLVSNMGISNSFAAIILPWAAYPVGIFFMRQTMQSIPDSLLEAARMDGATEFQLYYRVALPAVKSGMAALAVILFLFQWNLFLWPLVVLQEDKFTIPVALTKIMSQQTPAYDQLMVAALIAIVPMLIVFIALQRHFVNGILAGAVKE
ncbi:carbohydrate ABC transporter permease [Natronorubrum halophilum]|uniref:carbohydrate ABC transporter permease n=1 Tax=Natronorubrum halophilum TaxID=1702106 RepID=UPI000EF6BAE8|nr:carbohydrate ABC transporter permease [Natronorubrum halophilum]